jgi:hypothetical protein
MAATESIGAESMTSPDQGRTTDPDRSPGEGERSDSPLDQDLTEAVERSYAMRLTAALDLTEDEIRRIRDKQSGVTQDAPIVSTDESDRSTEIGGDDAGKYTS